MKTNSMNKFYFLILLLVTGCSTQKEKSEYEQLLDYEGTYEYVNESTLYIIASEFDKTLYAVIDKAKYPLKHIALDTFANIADISVIFERDKSNQVIAYKTDGQNFKLIASDFEKMEMFPRKELFDNPDNYVYQKPKETSDGLKTGHLKDGFKNTVPIINMVKETIKGKYPDVHSILIYKDKKLVLEEY
ncbi:MAG: hypothetical protein ACI9DK_001639, partial [Vicingaceae bacterium]